MTDTILYTKLHTPPSRSSLVPRARLIAVLEAGADEKLILVSAAAGYGKTTLVTEWLQATPIKSTWFSLDEGDNDPRRFMTYLLAALRKLDPQIGRGVGAMLQSPQPPPAEVILTTLVNDITAIQQPFILVLDDYHVIHSPAIHQSLNFLLEHQPAQMHLALVTREDPPLPLARLRARGQMVELRQADLRFTPDECAIFLTRVMELDLQPEDIQALERRTEGWIAGLQLAAISMRGRDDLPGFIEAFTGSSHYVLDYLIEEVFKNQPAEVQDFLVKTSILERLSAPLCDAVVGRTGSRNLLEHLERANLFIVPLDPSCTWYRYHRLFAELLRQRLHASEAFSEKELHRLACAWFKAQGLIPEAIEHALAGCDWERVAGLIAERSVSLLGQGEFMTLSRWFKALPDEVVRGHPQLSRDYGWALTLTGELEVAKQYLDNAEQAVQGNNEYLGSVLVAQAYLARACGAFQQAIVLSRRALELIPESDELSRGLAMFTLGFSLFNTGQIAEAEPVLMEACRAARSTGNEFGRLTILGLLGAIQSNLGRLHRASEFHRQALEEAHGLPIAAQAQVFLGIILYEWNELDEAEAQLDQALRASHQIGSRAIEADACRAMVRIKLAQGNPSAALEAVDRLNRVLTERDFPRLPFFTAVLRTEIALAAGDMVAAAHWAQQMEERVIPGVFGLQLLVRLTKSNLLLAQGNKEAAAPILAGLYQEVSAAGMVSTVMEVRLLQALAAAEAVDALRFLEDALVIAQPGGYIRTFLEKGETMKALLGRLKAEGGERKAYILTLLAAFGGESARILKSQPLIEPMSERELDVLRLLVQGLSNREIAQRLVVSVGTVKSHVHSMIGKMGVASRAQVVARARELGLV